MGMLDQIKDMGKALLGGGVEEVVTEAVVTEAASTDAPGTEAPTTEVPEEFNTDAPSTEAVVTDAPTTEVPEESKTLSEIELLKKEIEDLKNPTTTKAPSTDAPIEEHNFMDGVDFDDVARDPDEFNKLLNAVFKKGVEAARGDIKLGNELVINSLPEQISNNRAVAKALEETTEGFYTNNEDLVPYKENVAAIFGELYTANPESTYGDVLDLTGVEVRKRLNLATPVVKSDKKPPKLPTNKGNKRKTTTELKGIASEIDAMNKVL